MTEVSAAPETVCIGQEVHPQNGHVRGNIPIRNPGVQNNIMVYVWELMDVCI